ncbi:Prephenate dehydrogenase [Lasiodiplodia theobromae]|uniref:Prephenate dehydrogenase [NADP(+)] n=1 Tax=Lasiodiplodia theobromae TaxID=45133 RepID=A0A5N5DHB0_9PEZI|nr:Prephenate dehydrogenase [Lasiodiplodia theobromae]KAB2577097.1 putative prephenate dehydrogenase (NADP(+)) [Lasiodiplodia theobromae]KAF4543732.1 Prephenate dehydrogenase [Lasiodiplodia theobromae]
MADLDKTVGIIGMGDMGKMYARRISEAGWRVNACDAPSKYEELKELYAGHNNIHIYPDGHLVSRCSDYIIYSVPAEAIDTVVAKYGPSTKLGAIVGGQTSCKAPEIAAFEKHLPPDVEIIPVHSLHGPGVDPKGQPLVLIKHRASDASFALVERILECLQSKHVYLTAAEHDRITADTQAVTHAAFLSMGAAWHANAQFPWEIPRYVGGIENVKINVTLRIYSNKWHVYAGLAILNPYAQKQIRQYAESVTELFKLMLAGHKEELRTRIYTAAKAVFKEDVGDEDLLLKDEVLDRFSLGEKPPERVKNNHLSLLAMLFRLWLGITEYLFRKPELLEEVIETAIHDNTFRADDLEFTFAARDWSDRVSLGHMDAYREKFEHIQTYFEPRFPEAKRVGNEMIKTILAKTTKP